MLGRGVSPSIDEIPYSRAVTTLPASPASTSGTPTNRLGTAHLIVRITILAVIVLLAVLAMFSDWLFGPLGSTRIGDLVPLFLAYAAVAATRYEFLWQQIPALALSVVSFFLWRITAESVSADVSGVEYLLAFVAFGLPFFLPGRSCAIWQNAPWAK